MEILSLWYGEHRNSDFVFHILPFFLFLTIFVFDNLCRISYFFHRWKLRGGIERDIIMGKITRHPVADHSGPILPLLPYTGRYAVHTMQWINTIQHGTNHTSNNWISYRVFFFPFFGGGNGTPGTLNTKRSSKMRVAPWEQWTMNMNNEQWTWTMNMYIYIYIYYIYWSNTLEQYNTK